MGSDSIVGKKIAFLKIPKEVYSHPINIAGPVYIPPPSCCDLYFHFNEEGGGRDGNEGREQRENNVREVYIQVILALLTLSILKEPPSIKTLKCLIGKN